MMMRKTVLLCLIAVMLGSCAGRRARNAMPSCSVPAVGACKPCRVACPTGQTPKCVVGQGDETSCNQPASCTCG